MGTRQRRTEGTQKSGKPLVMKSPLLLLSLLLAASSSACFRPDLSCTGCRNTMRCPDGLTCVEGFCVEKERDVPGCRELRDAASAQPDGATDAGADVVSSADADLTPPPDSGNGVPDGAEALLCEDRCCIGGACLEFTPRMQAGLMLWLDRTSMGAPGSSLLRWRDRSTTQTDAVALNSDSPPRVQADAVGPIVEIDEPRMVLSTERPLPRRLGFDDFTVYVLVRCDARTVVGPVFSKFKPERPHNGLTINCNHDGGGVHQGPPLTNNRAVARLRHDDLLPQHGQGWAVSIDTYEPGTLHLLGARRVGKTRFQLRVDGKVQHEVNVPDAVNLDDDLPVSFGTLANQVPSPTTSFDGGLAAVVVVSGQLSDEEVAALETFLLRTSAGVSQ
jgi:hypothetical protein